MEIKLKELELNYFKGIKHLKINFNDNETKIYGKNASGKTTLMDAYMWLLFDKDSSNNSNFNIKTILADGTVPQVDHTVRGIIEINEKEIELEKTYKEVWTKKRGSNKAEFTGHTTDYKFNKVPVKATDYKKRINSFINEEVFKLLSNPKYFNESLDKKERRDILMSLIDGITEQDIVKENEELKNLDLENHTLNEIEKIARNGKREANKRLREYPVRIDELIKSKIDMDFNEVEKELEGLKKELEKIEKEINTNNNYEEIEQINEKINSLKEKLYKLKSEDEERYQEQLQEWRKKENNSKLEYLQLKGRIKKLTEQYNNITRDIDRTSEELEKTRKEYVELAQKEYDGEDKCPTCHRDYPQEKMEELVERFHRQKAEKLNSINVQGSQLLQKEKEFQQSLEKCNKEYEEIEIAIKQLEDPGEKPKKSISKDIEQLEEEINKLNNEKEKLLKEGTDKEELETKKQEISNKISVCLDKLMYKESNKNADKKIEEYKKKEEELSDLYNTYEYQMYLVEEYNKLKADIIQKNIADKFELVSFRLFEEQINGGLSEVCDTTIGGVPYPDINSAGKINAGIDIINTLSRDRNIKVPIFVDNAESVNNILETDSQIIKLIVSEDENLRVEA